MEVVALHSRTCTMGAALAALVIAATLAQMFIPMSPCEIGYQPLQSQNKWSDIPQRDYIPPHLEANVTASPDTIWPEGSDGIPKNSTVTLSVNGSGGPAIAFRPQDTVFIMDCSQTMRYISDPSDLRLLAAQHYVDNMISPDRCAVVRLSSDATLVGGHGLTTNYTQVVSDIGTLFGTAAGQTNFEAAFSLATAELQKNGSAYHQQIEIFLTDGRPEPAGTNITTATMDALKAGNITVFTIGLGMAQDRSLLQWIANQTGGRYYDAPNASALDSIYDDIANQFKDYTASLSGKLYFTIPDTVHYANDTLTNSTGNVTHSLDGTTTFSFGLPGLMLGDWWNVSFNITSNGSGWTPLGLPVVSRVEYYDWNNTAAIAQFPERLIWVIPPTPVPPPMPLPPPAPPTPIPVPPPAVMAPVSQAAVTVQPVFSMSSVSQPTGISAAELLAPFFALGIGSFAKMRKRIKSKRTIDIGVRQRPKVPEGIDSTNPTAGSSSGTKAGKKDPARAPNRSPGKLGAKEASINGPGLLPGGGRSL